ncbi:MAG TPA: hypothetical protein VK509_07540 [Polyangiales bacterium]|nr:hypothetical protein [Polyangiales bacterium]
MRWLARVIALFWRRPSEPPMVDVAPPPAPSDLMRPPPTPAMRDFDREFDLAASGMELDPDTLPTPVTSPRPSDVAPTNPGTRSRPPSKHPRGRRRPS